MKSFHLSRLFLVCLLPALLAACGPRYYWGEAQEVIDGDRINAASAKEGWSRELYLAGADAPEPGQPYAREARDFVADLIRGKEVYYSIRCFDRRGRHFVDLYLPPPPDAPGGTPEVFVNEKLLEAGLAWWPTYTCPEGRLQAAMEKAKKARRGIWAEKEPTPPWAWRMLKLLNNPPDRCCKVCPLPEAACGDRCVPYGADCGIVGGCACDAY